ncbi:Piwi-like protein [Caenorhabditis elegans]|uniref:Piwi-like protein n=1 Tax=Caenorhabditis elegans TaxID=6239 RepID=A0A0T7CIX3_CAEEL|nr:Piwi-like protein [Caenorhabditis elegans]CCD70367.1 Piwi-like protein [Caenorhabditis elegans]|eukprot:NP_504610.1 Piwi-like protein [Caenorhabditis elegans]
MSNITQVTSSMASASLSNKAPLPVGHQPLAEKKPKEVNQEGTPVQIVTNMRKINLEKNHSIFKYSVQVLFVYQKSDGTELVLEKSKSVGSGCDHERSKSHCLRVYRKAAKQCQELKSGGPFCYDSQGCLYSFSKLKNDEFSTNITGSDISNNPKFLRVEFKLAKVQESFQTTTNDVAKSVNCRPALQEKTILEAMNQIVSTAPINHPNVLTIGNCVHYLYDDTNIDIRSITGEGGKSSAVGASKSVRTLEGTGKTPCLYMATELKTTLFHPDNCSLLKVFMDYRGFNGSLKANSPFVLKNKNAFIGLWCYTTHGKCSDWKDDRPMIKIKDFGLSAKETTFERDNKKISVFNYFQVKYNMTLKYPDLFTVVARGKDGKNQHIPVECLDLCNSQTVRTEQMVGTEQADLIKLAAAKPHDRKKITDTVVNSIGLASEPKGIISVGAPESVTGLVLPKPDIYFSGGKKVFWNDPKKRGPATDFMPAGTFIKPTKLTNWEVVFDNGVQLVDCIQHLTSTMRQLGMEVSNPTVSLINRGYLRSIFENAKAANRQLIMFITKSMNNYHTEIKCLEQEFDLLTQDIRFETAVKLAQQQNTRKNIIYKTNMKLGGLNYELRSGVFSNSKRLIIGFETSQRGGLGDAPIAIGFAANMMSHSQQFAGGYMFVKKSADNYGPVIPEILLTILKQAKANRPNDRPDELLIYFSGVSEGQHALVNEYYANQVKAACGLFNESFRPHITLILASKVHNTRVYKSENGGGVCNVEPGTVIDHTIVSPVLSEWYHAGSLARQGTSKLVKYSLIFNTKKNEKLSVYERLTNELCYEMQIVFHPTSLPIPLHIAGTYSERGSQMLALKKPIYTNGEFNQVATNEQLGYASKKLFGTRFNA